MGVRSEHSGYIEQLMFLIKSLILREYQNSLLYNIRGSMPAMFDTAHANIWSSQGWHLLLNMTSISRNACIYSNNNTFLHFNVIMNPTQTHFHDFSENRFSLMPPVTNNCSLKVLSYSAMIALKF